MPRPFHSEDLKRRAVALAVNLGPKRASEILHAEGLDVKVTTLRSWCSRAGVATQRTERLLHAVEMHQRTAEERRSRLADRMLDLAEMATDQCQEMIAEASLRDVVGLFTRAVHDHQLLSGNATARSEQMIPEDAHAVIDKLAERRTA